MRINKSKIIHFNKIKFIAKFEYIICLIAALFFLSYYLTIPVLNIDKDQIILDSNVVVSSFITILFLPFITRQLRLIPLSLFYLNNNSKQIKLIYLFFSFLIFAVYLNSYSWDGVNSIYHSISALLRIIWLFYGIQINEKTSRKYILSYLIMSLILGFVDTQRTYLLLYLLIAFFQLRFSILPNILLFTILLISLSLIAALRDGQPFNIFQSVVYAFSGETYLATLNYAAAFNEINFSFGENFYHLFYLFFSPLLVLINKILALLPFDFGRSHFFPDLFQVRYGSFNSMGGHFISSTFLSFKSWQLIIQPIYFVFTYTVTKRLIGPLSLPLSSILFFLCIKSTPYVYWNLVLIILIFGFALKFMSRIKIT